MRKLKLFFACLLMAVLSIGQVWGETITINKSALTHLTGGYSDGAVRTDDIDGVTFTYSYLMYNGNNIQAQASNGNIYNSTLIPGKITNVAITHSGTGRSTTIYMGTSSSSITTQAATGNGSVSGNAPANTCPGYFKITRGGNAAQWTKIEVTYTPATITLSKNSITNLDYTVGSGASDAQTFTVSGSNIPANLTVTAPTNFEVSLNGSSWASTQTINVTLSSSANAGTLSTTPVYVRLASGKSAGNYNGNVSIAMAGCNTITNVNPKTVAVSGTVSAASSCDKKVALTKGSTEDGAFTLDQANGSYDNCDANFVVHVSNIVPANNAKYCNGIEATGGYSIVTGPVEGVWTVTYTKGNNITSTITPTYADKTTASITFVNAGTPAPTTSGYYVGDSYPLPSTNNYSCNGKTFVGWSTVEVAETDDAPAMLAPGEEVTLAASQTFYAVFATASSGTASYKLVESTPSSWDGDYLIVYNNTNAMNTHYGNADANTYATYADISSYYTSNTKSIAANNTTNAYAYTVASSTNGYTIKRKAATEYLGYNSVNSSTGSKLRWDGTITTNQNEWTLGVGSIVSVYDEAVAIRWNNNSGSYRFAIYGTSGQSAIQLFKYDPGVSYSAYSTDCTTSCTDPEIGTQPAASTTYAKNASPVTALTVTATGTGTLTYQWYSNDEDSNEGGTPISGATNSSYTPSVATVGTYYYYCVVGVQGEACSTTSNVATINVTQAITSISLNKASTSLDIDETETLIATIGPNDATEVAVWESNAPSIATVSNTGIVTAKAIGSAKITCKSPTDNTIKDECTVTVTAASKYKKVTSAPADWSGEYLLVYEPDANTAYVWTGEEAVNSYASATIENNKITKPANGVKLTIAAMTGGYSIMVNSGTNDGKYIYGTSGSNGVWFSDEAQLNTISVSDGDATITSNTSFMQYNSAENQKRFRYYKSGTTSQNDVQLYRKVVTSAVTVTTPATGTGTLNVTGAANLSAVDAGEQLTVTATPNSENHYIGGTVTVTKTVGGDDVTAAVYNNGTITMPEYAITVSATFTPTYAITAASVSGGSFSWEDDQSNVEPEYVAAGTQIQASANETSGYVFDSYDIYQTGATSTKVSHTNGLFTMPAYAVTIGGTFNAAPTITLSQTSTMAFAKVGTNASTSQTFTVNAANLTAGSLSISKGGTNPEKFNLSVSSITVTAGTVSNAEVTVTPVTTAAGDYTATITVDDGEGGAAAKSFTVTLHVEDQYTAKWYVNGEEQTTYTVTDFEETDLTFPDAPSATGDCAGLVFKGWLTAPLASASATAPTGLITTHTGHKMPAADVNYYAVFADETPGAPTTDTWVLTSSDINKLGSGTSYSDYDGDRIKGGITFTTSNVMVGTGTDAGKIQLRANTGTIYNKTAMPGDIVSISIADIDLAVYQGTEAISSTPSSGAISKSGGVYPFSTGKRYFHIKKNSSNAGYSSSITVTYNSVGDPTYSNYVTSCIACSNVSLVEAGETNGTITLKEGTKAVSSVKTCNGAVTLTTNAEPATGYELTNIELSGTAAAKASVNPAMTEISIQADATGELTVTATFTAIDHAVTMTQTGGAGAELTGAKDDAHYDETIYITAEDKAGYQFLGWEASPEVTFVDASALSTSFTMPNEAVEVTAKYAQLYTISFYVGSSTDAYDEVTTYVGNTIDLSSIAAPTKFADEYPNFIGWSETKFTPTNSEPTIVSGTITINGDDEYYAVFGNALTVETNKYAKVNAIESGKNYLVVAEYDDKYYAMKNESTGTFYIAVTEVAPTDGIITSDANHQWTLTTPSAGKVTIYNADAKYVEMYVSSTFKNLRFSESAYEFSYEFDNTDQTWKFEGVADNFLKYYVKNTYKEFAAKENGEGLAYPTLYKQIVKPTVWATYENVTVSYYDNVNNTNPIHTALVAKGNNTVDLTYEPDARVGFTFTGWSLTTAGAVIPSLSNIIEDTELYAIWAPDVPATKDVVRDGLSNGKWGTLCPAQDVTDVEGAVFYLISYLEEDEFGMPFNMVFDEINGPNLQAGKPYFFIANANEIRGYKTGSVLDAAGDGVNGFYGYIGASSMELTDWHTDYDATPGAKNTFVIYNNCVMRINQSGTMLRSERCYININNTEPSRTAVPKTYGRRRITMQVSGANVATGVEDIKASDKPIKMMIDGQLYILRGEKMYDATGKLVK